MATRMALRECVACGRQFEGGNRASLCPTCRKKAHDGKFTVAEMVSMVNKIPVKPKRKSMLTERQQEAACYGLSYGMYQSLRLVGQLQKRPKKEYINPDWQVWKKIMYDTVDACRRRAQARLAR